MAKKAQKIAVFGPFFDFGQGVPWTGPKIFILGLFFEAFVWARVEVFDPNDRILSEAQEPLL